MSYQMLHGDSYELIKTLPDNSVDAVCTDPPYGLGTKEPDIVAVLTGWLRGDAVRVNDQDFMGRDWLLPGPDFWREVYRVMKPGAHILVFAGSKGFDLMSMALRLAGFECRDTIASFGGQSPMLEWIGSGGMPKSGDLGKAFDERAGVEREIVGFQPYTSPVRPGGDCLVNRMVGAERIAIPITAPVTAEAKRWHGWSTTLSPSHEPILMFRKPLSEPTVVENLRRWGCGALNIDGCRIPTNAGDEGVVWSTSRNGKLFTGHTGGRWPTNVVMHRSAAPMIDAQTGRLHPRGNVGPEVKRAGSRGYLHGCNTDYVTSYPHSQRTPGGASKFFFQYEDDETDVLPRALYCPKVGAAERDAGCECLAQVSRDEQGNGFSASLSNATNPRANTHPCLKPIQLLRYLVRLITPTPTPDCPAVVLDPFAGAGSCGCAAVIEGFDYIGMEMDDEYVEIANYRIAHWNGTPLPPPEHTAVRARTPKPVQYALFSEEAPPESA
jgi:DNA modification methylase